MPRLLICFSLWAVCSAAATVTGSVTIHGGRKSSYSDVVVWLQPVGTTTPAPEGELPHRTLLQKNKMFRPHVLPVRAGTVIDFPNADPIFHNAFSNYDGQLFDVSLYPPGTSRSVLFKQPGVVRVFCNIHPMMSAVILVLDTPYFARVDSDGHFHINSVPPGTYQERFFDERATKAGHDDPTVAVNADDTVAAQDIDISESGYTQTPHKNKYGRDYPSADTYSDVPR